jgi:hypothetical protein
VTEDGGSRYVAQENITDGDSVVEASHVALAGNYHVGRYFRKRERTAEGRWAFVKSEEVKAMYPE